MRYGVINDAHRPFHDPIAYELAIDVIADSCDTLIINGDFVDFYNINSHEKGSPLVQESLETEIQDARDELQRLSKRFEKIIYIFGNHEYRLDRYIKNFCPHFWNMFALPRMLNLDELGIEWLEYNLEYELSPNFKIQHSPPSYSENCAMASLKKKAGASFLYGCTHRIDFAIKNLSNGGVCRVYMNGWLGSTNLTRQHFEVFRYQKNHANWQQCFAIITEYQGEFFVEQVPIINHKCVTQGNLWET